MLGGETGLVCPPGKEEENKNVSVSLMRMTKFQDDVNDN